MDIIALLSENQILHSGQKDLKKRILNFYYCGVKINLRAFLASLT